MSTTVADVFRATAAERPDQIAFRSLERDGVPAVQYTWSELRQTVDDLAKGLHELGVDGDQQIALMLLNRPEFHVADLAGVMLGAATTSVYVTLAPEQIEYLLNDAEVSVVFTEQLFLPVIEKVRANVPSIKHVIVVDGQGSDDVRTMDQVIEMGRGSEFDIDASVQALTPETIITLIYTSGTTGNPKGVQLSHANVLAAFKGAEGRAVFPDPSRVISWLPAAHIAERMAHHYLPLKYGTEVTTCPDPRLVGEYLPQVRPTWFFAVPRVWEKMKSAVEAGLAAIPGEQGEQARGALQAAIKKVKLEQSKQPVPAELAAIVEKADAALFAGLRQRLGLDEVSTANVGASPTPPEVLEFFHAIGVPVSEIWGMSETAGLGASNPPEDIRIGTVGTAPDNVELKIGDDGELLLKSDVVMVGYRNLPEQNRDTVVDGWLHTGDIATIDEDGYVTIVDRKKELIINSMGKNMSPAMIESRLKTASPLIGQAVAIGDNRPYNTALIVLDPESLPVWAAAQGIEGSTPEELAKDERLLAAIDEAVQEANSKLARVEQIKKYTVLPHEWLPAGDELTPTMKLRRRPITQKYHDQIEAMYADG
ncbi:long-chain fatty acid--CoA ligase [Blastococcus sp. Marseille-P5729]|uniref:AMP-dependent synthetase/ligase n=1 Tax=Blastococcus sp. Marseille-P5729 TaxID=2086582 RepID=UPI000D0F13CC|nr:AMP-dependent synthetase/ligase [Blastococcus sp. Marseille-P5729]